MASNVAAQAATRTGTGRRRQGPASGPAGTGAKAQAGAAVSAPALRPLDELRAEWMRRRERANGETGKTESVKQGGSAAAGGSGNGGAGGGQRRKAQARAGEGGNSRSGANGANGADAGAALLRMLKSNPDARGDAAPSGRSPDKKSKHALRAADNMGGAGGQSPTACSLPGSEQVGTYDEYEYWESDESSRGIMIDASTEVLDSEETRYEREVLLRMRPRPGPLPEVPHLPKTLELLREETSASTQHNMRSGAAEQVPPAAEEQCVPASVETAAAVDGTALEEEKEACEPHAEEASREHHAKASPKCGADEHVGKANPDSLFDAAAAEALDWGLEEEEEQPAGVEASRGFSKWFARRKGSSGTGLGEAGVSTDAGSGADESSDEEAELQLTSCDGLPSGDYDVDVDAPSAGGAASGGAASVYASADPWVCDHSGESITDDLHVQPNG